MAIDTRRNERHPVEIQGRYRTGSGQPRDVIVTDLSKSGCRIFDRFCNLDLGRFITLRIGSIGPIDAKVVWRKSDVAGLQFGNDIHPQVLEHMVYTVDGWSRPGE
jgi:hypothetical protein